MNEILFSRQQYDAIISRLNEIRERLPLLKHMEPTPKGCIEANDIVRQYHISKRTLDRWRSTGRVPYHKVGNFVYFKTEDILGQIGTRDNRLVLSVPETDGLSEKELRERHRVALLTSRHYKVPPSRGIVKGGP